MSPKLRRLRGPEVISALEELGFDVERQRGSHVKLRRVESKTNAKQTLTVPNHKALATGTLRAVARQAARYLTEEEIQRIFFVD